LRALHTLALLGQDDTVHRPAIVDVICALLPNARYGWARRPLRGSASPHRLRPRSAGVLAWYEPRPDWVRALPSWTCRTAASTGAFVSTGPSCRARPDCAA
jgi:hypothetical protein